MTLNEIRKDLLELGYQLQTNVKDFRRKSWRYGTTPIYSGPTNYFNHKEQLQKYVKDVRQIRNWQTLG